MWNKEYEIYGYHIREEGKPVEVSKVIDKERRHIQIITVTPFRGGRLLASVAIARNPPKLQFLRPNNRDTFFRAVARVHNKDIGIATKTRGREIALGRMMLALDGKDFTKVDTLFFDELSPLEQRLFLKKIKDQDEDI